ncbi:MAG: class I SAM-dependent methyltransferase [Planctomycetota bacterium]|nr:class I SAM-dependent methyltransferase [Planctomycetota bacterium]
MDLPRPPKLDVYQDQSVAQQYDQRWSGSMGAKRDRRKSRAIHRAYKILDAHHQGCEIKSIFDIPCGTGRFSNLLDQFGCTTLGVDLSQQMIDQAKIKHPQKQYQVADMQSLPFSDNQFDIGMCIRMLHLVHKPKLRVHYLRELNRVCRLGAIIDYRHSHTVRIMSRKIRFRLGLFDENPQLPSPKQIQLELQQSGFTPLAKINVHFAPFLSDKLIFPVVPSDA